MLKFSEIFEFSKEKVRKIPILKEFEWFEWFGPSPTEPFNSAWYMTDDRSADAHIESRVDPSSRRMKST